MDAETRRHFVEHVKSLEDRALSGDFDAQKSLCCMVLIKEFSPDPDPGEDVVITTFDGDVVDMSEWLRRRAA